MESERCDWFIDRVSGVCDGGVTEALEGCGFGEEVRGVGFERMTPFPSVGGEGGNIA